jgi:hypothetical protein
MQNSSDKKFFRDNLKTVREKLICLPEKSHIRAAMPTSKVKEIAERIEQDDSIDLEWTCRPSLYQFLKGHSLDEIKSFESDIALVVGHSNEISRREIIQCLKANDRQWVGWIFETFVKARFVKEKGCAVELDHPLPNQKKPDIRFVMGGKAFYLECTVLTGSEQDRKTWDRYIAAKKVDPNASLLGPVKFDSANSTGPGNYYDCIRFYTKVYDKIAKDLDPRKSQMAEGDPNVLLICLNSSLPALSATSRGVGWALDELFADQPKIRHRSKDQPPGIVDISLSAWLDITASDLSQKCRLDWQTYRNTLCDELLAAPRKIGGVLLFDGCSLKASRVNYHANKECRLSHHEIDVFEKLLETPPDYCLE